MKPNDFIGQSGGTPQGSKNLPEVFDHLSGRSNFWIVGGSVRDLLFERTPTDYDIAVDGNPEIFADEFARSVGATVVKIGKEDKAIWRVVLQHLVIDISGIEGKSIEEDLARRDFTINSMALSVREPLLIDPMGGRRDLDRKRVRMTSPGIFDKDPVRLVRAYRMAAALHFDLDPETEDRIREKAPWISLCAGERVREELFKIFQTPRSASIVARMAKTGLLQSMLPEVGKMELVGQGDPHQFDVLEHTLKALGQLEAILTDPSRVLPLWGTLAAERLDRTAPALLKAAALFHDIGKPETRRIDSQGRVRFHGHAVAGARMVESIADRLHFSNLQRCFVGFMVRHHTRPLHLFLAHRHGSLTSKGKTRMFIRCADLAPPLLLLSCADMAAKRSVPDVETHSFLTFIDHLLSDYFVRFRQRESRPPLIDGHDLMERFGLDPSPLLGRVLKRIEAERLEGALDDREGALCRAADLIASWTNAKRP